MSKIALAELIDRLVDEKHAFIIEAEQTANVSSLSASHAAELREHVRQLGWRFELFDSAQVQVEPDEKFEDDFGPFRIVIYKPTALGDTLQLLTNTGFAYWLAAGHEASHWHIVRITATILTASRVFQPWCIARHEFSNVIKKSPRSLVREFRNERRVPEDIGLWIPFELGEEVFKTPAGQIWVRAAASALIYSLPEEIDLVDGSLKFRGPPRVALIAPDFSHEILDFKTFTALQVATKWVFENEREAEMRHILLAAELARSDGALGAAWDFFQKNLIHALESAQIAYQMALAETSRDALKLLGDLRKTVTDETSKLSEMSRQLAASVAASLAAGIALVAARVAANAPPYLMFSIMAVVTCYVAMVIHSGWSYIRLQRSLRVDWQSKLYRFLPPEEYTRLMLNPTGKAEKSFRWTALLGGAAIVALWVACFSVLGSTKAEIEVNSSSISSERPTAQGLVMPPDALATLPLPTSNSLLSKKFETSTILDDAKNSKNSKNSKDSTEKAIKVE